MIRRTRYNRRPPLVPSAPTPSARLVRAAAAERAELDRHRDRLITTRASLRTELEAIEASLRELDERDALLDRLAGPARPAAVAGHAPRPPGARLRRAAGPVRRRCAARRSAVRRSRSCSPIPIAHRRSTTATWFTALLAAGYEVAGKDPLAVFLTQLGRSPVVRRGTQSGVYELDRAAPRRLRDALDALHAELRGIAGAPTPTADLTAIRARRAALTAQITQVEKALEEAEAVLGSPAGTVAAAG